MAKKLTFIINSCSECPLIKTSEIHDLETSHVSRNFTCTRLNKDVAQEIIDGNVIIYSEGIIPTRQVHPECLLSDYILSYEMGVSDSNLHKISDTPTQSPLSITNEASRELQLPVSRRSDQNPRARKIEPPNGSGWDHI